MLSFLTQQQQKQTTKYWWKIMTLLYKRSLVHQLFLSVERLNALLLQCIQCSTSQQNTSANTVHTHTCCDWFFFPLLNDCHTTTFERNHLKPPGQTCSHTDYRLCHHLIDLFFSAWVSFPPLPCIQLVYFHLFQQVLRWLPKNDPGKNLWNRCTSLSTSIQDNTW